MMIQLRNLHGDSYIYINVDAIATLSPVIGEPGTVVSTVSGNVYSVMEDPPTINSMIISAKRG